MLALIAAVISLSSPSREAKAIAICEVGRVALKDLPSMNGNPGFDAYYDAADPLLAACPRLRRDIPAGYPLSDLDALERANAHVPVPGKPVRPAFIYHFGVPKFSPDLQSATFRMGYSCTGLCGATFVARYVRTAEGWHNEGGVRIMSVS